MNNIEAAQKHRKLVEFVSEIIENTTRRTIKSCEAYYKLPIRNVSACRKRCRTLEWVVEVADESCTTSSDVVSIFSSSSDTIFFTWTTSFSTKLDN